MVQVRQIFLLYSSVFTSMNTVMIYSSLARGSSVGERVLAHRKIWLPFQQHTKRSFLWNTVSSSLAMWPRPWWSVMLDMTQSLVNKSSSNLLLLLVYGSYRNVGLAVSKEYLFTADSNLEMYNWTKREGNSHSISVEVGCKPLAWLPSLQRFLNILSEIL